MPIVVATDNLKKKNAVQLKKAAHMTACSGLKTLVATIVAIELAASWKPLVNSKIKARKITNKVNINYWQHWIK